MRHAKKFNHLGRKTAHRKAMLENMSASLIMSKRIFTTTAKAKALRVYLEPVITKSKTNSTHSRRTAFSYLGSNITAKNATKELFDVIAPKIGERPGGYLRIIKTGFRAGDSAEMSMIEFVDFNETYTQTGTETKKKATRRRGGKKSAATAEISAPSTEETSTPEEGSEETKAE